MSKLLTWSYIAAAVIVALSANSISAIWAGKEHKFSSPWFLILIIISPFVFIIFGLITARMGLSATSATVDVLLTASTILVGLFFFREAGNVSFFQLLGMALAFIGIILMQFHK